MIEAELAHTAGDLIVHIPDTTVVWADDVPFIKDVPAHRTGPSASTGRTVARQERG
ncbi:hypothetical protein ACFCYX_04815 [Streptomyces populi]|uniref:hypothetical protein n=1 Tax=Streptomyces populi TaxID=2058924 RepID=UPI0013A68930|nr:hypothetical protein [Streptomyces populi]